MMERRRSERGVALAIVAVMLVVIFGFAALGIDIARLAFTATEVQSVADAAARGGAKALQETGGTPNAGITRAHVIAGMNFMNGSAAPNEDVLVDEGHYDLASAEFECCTNNSPCCQNGSRGDLTCVGANSCNRRTAVLAAPRTDVDNLLAGVLDYVQGGRFANADAGEPSHAVTRIEKMAVAAPSGPGAGCQMPTACSGLAPNASWGCLCSQGIAPCLPFAVPSCEFIPPNCDGTNCSLPAGLKVSNNNTDKAAWTGFGQGHADSTIRRFLEQGPCTVPGPDAPIPPQVNGPDIDLTNGINSNGSNNVFALARCLYDNNQGCKLDGNGQIIPGERGRIFTIPIFDEESSTCTGNLNGQHPIIGWATVELADVQTGSTRSVTLNVVRNQTGTTSQIGGGCFGTDCRVTMAR